MTTSIKPASITVDLGAKPRLPFDGAIVESHIGEGVVTLEKRENGLLYMDGRNISLTLSKSQLKNNYVRGYEVRDELMGEPLLNANILDALYQNPQLIPWYWEKAPSRHISHNFFWGTIFRNSQHYLYVRELFLDHRGWCSTYRSLDTRSWSEEWVAAVLKS
jgi:hypothetical protein